MSGRNDMSRLRPVSRRNENALRHPGLDSLMTSMIDSFGPPGNVSILQTLCDRALADINMSAS